MTTEEILITLRRLGRRQRLLYQRLHQMNREYARVQALYAQLEADLAWAYKAKTPKIPADAVRLGEWGYYRPEQPAASKVDAA